MACITISGFPCSGKTTRSNQLKEYLETRLGNPEYLGDPYKVEILSDDFLNVPRSAYDDGRKEKPARSALFTAVNRALSANTIVIIDGMNYIKGFRYQIYCAAREANVRPCTVHVVATPAICKERHDARDPAFTYLNETFENLITRYEEPSSMVRWDTPLFVVPWDEDLPGDAIFQAVTTGEKKRANQGVTQVTKPPTDALQTLEQTATSMVNLILSAQSGGVSLGGPLTLTLPTSTTRVTVTLPYRNITLSELQRLKRQFISVHKKAVSQGLSGKADLDWSEETLGRKFATSLEENLRP